MSAVTIRGKFEIPRTELQKILDASVKDTIYLKNEVLYVAEGKEVSLKVKTDKHIFSDGEVRDLSTISVSTLVILGKLQLTSDDRLKTIFAKYVYYAGERMPSIGADIVCPPRDINVVKPDIFLRQVQSQINMYDWESEF